MKTSYVQTILLSFLLAACAGLPASAQSEEPVFVLTTKNGDDQVDIQYENGVAFVDIHSPTGIGSATLELESGTMPGEMTLRLHLKGLEELRLTSTQTSLAASVSNSDPADIRQRILAASSDSPLLPSHPLWMQIEIVAPQAEKRIPLEEGYFEITVPPEFLRKAGNSLEIQWTDFFR
jgi:hypothetical protein